jgi:DNA-binding response OmpR family regulator
MTQRSGATVLLVEDDPDIRRVMAIKLRHAGIEVLEAGDGDMGMKMVEEYTPDLICLDLNLPVISGYEILRRMRKQAHLAKVPVLIVSARDSLDDHAIAQELGVTGYILKPFKPRVLLSKVKECLRAIGRSPTSPGLPTQMND